MRLLALKGGGLLLRKTDCGGEATVGYRDVVLPEAWRLVGPIEAAVGVLMLGWSTGVLVVVIGVIYKQFSPSLTAPDGPPARPPA